VLATCALVVPFPKPAPELHDFTWLELDMRSIAVEALATAFMKYGV
jgi:hypothetical protein